MTDQSDPTVARSDDRPDVSVIVPTYNAEAFIARALQSVVAQDGVGRVEIIACDDASKDGTVAELRRLAQEIPDLRIFENTVNGGPSVRRNQGVSAAGGGGSRCLMRMTPMRRDAWRA